MKILVLLTVTLLAGSAFAQENPDTTSQPQIPGNTAPPLLQKPYETVKDFFNFFAFANGVLDSNGAYVQNANVGETFGEMVGGGASGYHQFATGSLSIYYNGDYRHYNSDSYGNGTDQNLSIFYQKLGKRWKLTVGETAGEFFQGGASFSTEPNQVNPGALVQTSPISTRTRFAGTTLSATYQQSLRLSYSVSASYFLQRYNGFGSVGINNFIGTGSAIYRLSRRTSVSGSYSHSKFLYAGGEGDSNVDVVYLTLGHDFASHWTVSASGGISRADSNGTYRIPISLPGFAQPVYLVGPYHEVLNSPYYQATATRLMRFFTFSASGGETVGPGNGFFLASKVEYVGGYFNYRMRRANLSGSAYVSRLSSASAVVSGHEVTTDVGAAYAYNLVRHVGLNLRYDYIKYSTLGLLQTPSDNRISFGVFFTSKDVPLTWH